MFVHHITNDDAMGCLWWTEINCASLCWFVRPRGTRQLVYQLVLNVRVLNITEHSATPQIQLDLIADLTKKNKDAHSLANVA